MARKLRVLILCGGPSSEHDVSLNTGEMVLKNLDRKKYAAQKYILEKSAPDISPLVAKIKKSDFIFIAMHGIFGEDGRMQALCEWMGVPYSGSGVLSSAMAMDKHVSNALYSKNGMRVPKYAVVDEKNIKNHLTFPVPAVVKPVDGGSSVGVSIIKEKSGLLPAIKKSLKTSRKVLAQEYIEGREFTCGVIEKNGKSMALPPTEIIPRTAAFFDYHAKYQAGGSEEITPARLPLKQTRILQQLALDAHRILGCSGMSRSDFIFRGGKFYILETNTIPGMTQTSLLPQAAQADGISFSGLLDLIIASGLRRYAPVRRPKSV